MRDLLRSAMQVAQTDACILILGESGTGKELVAQAIHQASPRRHKPFVAVNCSTLPANLAESLLFGHVKGAFTGASEYHSGLALSADGGTLFLDEIGELPLILQPKLLRFLESGEILPIGKTYPLRVNVRVLAATHCDLQGMVAAGTFRRDLFFRLNIIPLELPPLRQRKEDIDLLAKSFLKHFAVQHRRHPCLLDSAARTLLLNYRWPGNVRELRNLCEQLSILNAGKTITPQDLPLVFRQPATEQTTADSLFALPDEGINLEDMERTLLLQALERTRNNKTQAARLLGISRDTLNYRLKKFDLG